jgi:hypothetical protein
VFLLFGSRVTEQIVNVVSFVCGYCDKQVAQNVIESKNRFTLFFVPLFTFSRRYRNQCSNCGGRTELSAEQVRHSLEQTPRTAA